MLRKILPFGSRGCQAVFSSNIRSCQLAAKTNASNPDCSVQNRLGENKSKYDLVPFTDAVNGFKSCNTDLKCAEKLIFSLVHNSKVRPENVISKIVDFYNNSNDRAYQHNLREKFYLWCTGVLAVSSVILCQNWISSEHGKSRGLKVETWHDVQTVQIALKNYFWGIPINRILLPVLATPKEPTKKKEVVSPLDNAAKHLKATTDECTASILNKCGLQLLQPEEGKQAAELFSKAAESGNLAAMYNMGLCFELGKGVGKDFVKAAEFYKMAADRGHPRAQFNLATFYAEGVGGLKKDVVKATTMIEQAAENGITQAQLHMAFHFIMLENQTRAAKFFKMAAAAKDPVALYHFGICLENGFGTRKDVTRAGNMYQEAAEKGHCSAMFNTAVFYEKGLGDFTKSRNKAMYWLEKGAENGDEAAATKLKELRQTRIVTPNEMHPILKELLAYNIFKKRNLESELRKSKSTPDFQRKVSRSSGYGDAETASQSIDFRSTETSSVLSCGVQMSSMTSSHSDAGLAII